MAYDGTALIINYLQVGPSLSVSGGVIDVVPGGAPTWASITSKPTTLGGYGITDAYPLTGNPSGFATSSSVSAGLAGKFSNPTGTTAQYIRGDGSLATFPTIPTIPTRSFANNVSRSLNSNFTISTARDALVSYSINAAWNVAALLSGTGSAFLEYSTDAGATWITVNQVGKTLNLLTFAGQDDMNLVGMIPANALVRIRSTATNMIVTYTRGQETLF